MSITEKRTHANMFLIGYLDYDKGGLLHQKYLVSDDEGRRALADILISGPISRDLLLKLAAAIAPNNYTNSALNFELSERKLIFKFRSRTRRHDAQRNSAIVQYIQDQITAKKISAAKAIIKAADKYKLSEERTKVIWRGYRWARDAGLFNRAG